jgi:hypothetical protein
MLNFLDKYMKDCYITINDKWEECMQEYEDGTIDSTGNEWNTKLNYKELINVDTNIKDVKNWIISCIKDDLPYEMKNEFERSYDIFNNCIITSYPCDEDGYYTKNDNGLYLDVEYFVYINGFSIEEEDLIEIMDS